VLTLVPALPRNKLDYRCGLGSENKNSFRVYELLKAKLRAFLSSRSLECEWPASNTRSFISGIPWACGRSGHSYIEENLQISVETTD
jgi:hypothetical protein